jgi:hypothetical protein
MTVKFNDTNNTARFNNNGYRFVVKENDVLVYDRTTGGEYSMNIPQREDRITYDAKRYQVRKNRNLIDAVQTVISS